MRNEEVIAYVGYFDKRKSAGRPYLLGPIISAPIYTIECGCGISGQKPHESNGDRTGGDPSQS